MQWAGLVLAATLIGWALYWTLRPLFRPPDPESVLPAPPRPGEEDARQLLETKESLYRAIKELEFDYHTGKLSREDFEAMTERYRGRALDVLRRLDARGIREAAALREAPASMGDGKGARPAKDEALVAGLEEEIRALRKVKEPKVARAPVAPSGEPVEGRGNFCPQCGRRVSPGDNFCAGCGKRLIEG